MNPSGPCRSPSKDHPFYDQSSKRNFLYLAPKPVKILAIKQESHNAFSWLIEAPSDMQAWEPGQFNMIYIHGRGEVAISISGDGGVPHCYMHTIKEAGSVTGFMSRLKTPLDTKDLVSMRGPFGSFWPHVPEGRDLVLIGGGIGLAPLRAVIEKYLKAKLPHSITLIYGMKCLEDALFRDEWAIWEATPHLRFIPMLDQKTDVWPGEVGYVHTILPRVVPSPENTYVMMCGPDIMMRKALDQLELLGVPQDQIFVSLGRHLKCAIGLCGRCQWGPYFICTDGPVFSLARIRPFWDLKEF